MCGIAGMVDLADARPIERQTLERMNGAHAHRGPDGEGYHVEPGVGFGHRRLSIIDLEGGRQPLFNEDGTVAVTFNGEIYNFQPLMAELIARGHRFKTRCDTEVIVHAWEEWGEDCVLRFNGMFAFAVWDRNKQTLFLARDRLGIKPLYYALTPDQMLLFGSELKSILASGLVERRIRPQSVEEYFAFGYVPDPNTILENVYKLSPGHTLTLRRKAVRVRQKQYWDVVLEPKLKMDETQLQDELVARLRASVESQMIAEVPLGAFLSGGVDSSAVVAMMAEISPTPVRTRSIAFGHRSFDESRYAEIVASKFKTAHGVQQVDPDDHSLLDKLGGLYDEPFADSSALPTYHVCRLARKEVTVALSGDGGDENFGGYRRYRWHAYEEKVRSRIPAPFRRTVFGALGALYPKLDWAPRMFRAKSTFQAIARDGLAAYFHSVSVTTGEFRRRLFSTSFARALQGYDAFEVFRGYEGRAPKDSPLALVQYLDFKTYLPGDILTKVDRASMAHSLEVRVPLLDHELVDWVGQIDPGLKLNGSEGKYIFKKALESRLPHEILYRPKMGFAVPLAQWFKHDLHDVARAELLDDGLYETGIFERAFVERMLDDHRAGRTDYGSPLWALMMFRSFQRRIQQAAA